MNMLKLINLFTWPVRADSEGSVALGSEMLRYAQHDRAVTHTYVWIILFICIIGRYSPEKKRDGISIGVSDK
jgi:hypothetical protein